MRIEDDEKCGWHALALIDIEQRNWEGENWVQQLNLSFLSFEENRWEKWNKMK
jgi:hypothetical protein